MGLGDSPVSLRIALLVVPIAFILQLVGVNSTYWINMNIEGVVDVHDGIWHSCPNGRCFSVSDPSEWLKGVRGLELIGILLIFMSMVFIGGSVARPFDPRRSIMKLIALSTSFLAGVLIIIGVIVFVANTDLELDKYNLSINDYLSWSFGVCIAAGVLSVITGILVLVNFRS